MEPLAGSNTKSTSIVSELEQAINDEWAAAYQYWVAYNISKGPGKFDADPIFEEHVSQELKHVELLAQRIKELGGDFARDLHHIVNSVPYTVVNSDIKYLAKLIHDAELRAVDKYRRIAELTKDSDPLTHKIAVNILETEQEHEYELRILQQVI